MLGSAWAETIVIESPLPPQLPQPPFDFRAKAYEAKEKKSLIASASESCATGDMDRAIDFLQRATIEEDVALSEIEQSAKLAPLRNDPRWPKLRKHISAVEAAWPQSTFTREILTLPTGYDGKKELPLVLGLHGFGSWPEDFSGADHQIIADALGVAFLSISGKTPLNRQSFMWSARYEDDWKHIEAAIKRAEKHLRIAPGQMMAMGFSQGGQLAVDICAAHPQQFLGAIVMSPGSRHGSRLSEALATASGGHARQCYFLSWISGEGEATKQRSRDSKVLLEKQGATVIIHEFPGKGHEFPRAYADYFSLALQVMMKKR